MTSNGKDWQTCLGCHDYHGNHDMVLEKTVGRAIKHGQIAPMSPVTLDCPFLIAYHMPYC
jgi:hypothetical protein